MSRVGSEHDPLRVAVVGSGPAGFYIVQALLKRKDLHARIDMFDRLPTPFGLVRHGVAPDHPKIKSVIAVYHKLALQPGVRFFGNVEFGRDLSLDELRSLYHQVVFCTGAQTDRRLGIPGEDLERSHSATEFVAWYNGHPDYHDLQFDLGQERAVVIGIGNVAIDVARILCRTPEELRATDIAEQALEALTHSRVREVFLLGRRGPAQAAFTNPEIKELGQLADATTLTLAEEVRLDPLSAAELERQADRTTRRKVEILQEYASINRQGPSKQLTIRFLVSPVELLDDGSGGVAGVRIVRNVLHASEDGALRARATEEQETIDAGLVFRSVGYRGVPLAGLPFHDRWGLIPNDQGRIGSSDDGAALTGLYVSGWIKRGPSGVIGTNKPDAVETVDGMLEDLETGRHLRPQHSEDGAVGRLLAARGVRPVSYDDWQKLDALELASGRSQGRPRVKFVRHEEFKDALGS